ncbi:response regulator transcription factor [Cohnella sp. GbtcB17]|uniref:winged helix-turn-helix domain-containing protein n=1 Tax=Cohnella sp. GbtcB17 TaxID=2824762 RepID=UPI001C30D907
MKRTKTVLIIKEEAWESHLAEQSLCKDGWRTIAVNWGPHGMRLFEDEPPDLAILKLKADSACAENLCQKIRERSHVPIIVVLPLMSDASALSVLYQGADAYLLSPVNPDELVAKAHAAYRRSAIYMNQVSHYASYGRGRLVIDYRKSNVGIDGRQVMLTNTEYALLTTICEGMNRILTRSELMRHILGYRSEVDTRSIDVHIKNIRRKLEANPREPEIVLTVRGRGYKLGLSKDDINESAV